MAQVYPSDRIDYSFIINYQLFRLMEIRTHIHKYLVELQTPSIQIDRYYMVAQEYIAGLEALCSLLLPELRGEAEKYILMARDWLRISSDLNRIRDEEKIKKLLEIKDQIYENLPKRVRYRISSTLWEGEIPLIIGDLALEEMVKHLNEAGLLLGGGKVIRIGVPNVSSGSD